jgi:hypothetical protein
MIGLGTQIAGGVAIVAGIAVGVQTVRLNWEQEARETAENRLKVCEIAHKALAESANRQNEAIDALKDEGEARAAEAARQLAAARAQAQRYRTEAERLKAAEAEKTDGTCEEAVALIREGL